MTQFKTVEDTLPNIALPIAEPPGKVQRSKVKIQSKYNFLEEEELYHRSLTPVNVLQNIRQDIVTVLGISEGLDGSFTTLENQLVDTLEKVVRKGHCPSVLARNKNLFEALRCLETHFSAESVPIEVEDETGQTHQIKVRVFSTLVRNALDAANYEDRIREFQSQIRPGLSASQKRGMEGEFKKLRLKKDLCLLRYQKVVFSHASALREAGTPRKITIGGNHATLDEFVAFYKWR